MSIRRFITATLGKLLEVATVVGILFTVFVGWNYGLGHSLFGAIVGFLVGSVIIAVLFGVVFVLLDIEECSRSTATNTLEIRQALTSLHDLIRNMDEKIAQLESLKQQANSARKAIDG